MSSHFYIIVNGEKSLLEGFTGTEADLKAKTVNFTEALGSRPTLLTSGPSEYNPATASSEGTEDNKKVVFVSRLFRTYAI